MRTENYSCKDCEHIQLSYKVSCRLHNKRRGLLDNPCDDFKLKENCGRIKILPMHALELEDLYNMSKIDEFSNYHLFVRQGDMNVPLVSYETDVDNENLILWTEAELKEHLAKRRCKTILQEKIRELEHDLKQAVKAGMPTGGLYGELDTLYELMYTMFPETKPKETED